MAGPHRLRGKEIIIEEASEIFPHFRTYAQCQNKALLFGSFTFLSMASGTYIAQELMKSKLPFGRKAFLLAPILIGSLSAYHVTQHNTRICQHMWLALEEKHTAITPASEKLSQPTEESPSEEK